MRLARVQFDGSVYLARIADSATLLHRESDHPAADALREALHLGVGLDRDGQAVPLDKVTFLSPVANPSKYLGVGLNYLKHAEEAGLAVPDRPTLFVKTVNTIIGPSDTITIWGDTSFEVDFEVELVIVIGATLRNVDRSQARAGILGFTVGNDVTARDAQFADGQWVRSKSFDTFGPLGPAIVTLDELGEGPMRLTSTLNGLMFQDSTTEDMIFTPEQTVSYISRFLTLQPGDLITTGTPVGVGFAQTPPVFLRDGDLIEVAIDGIGACRNPVRHLETQTGT